VSTEPVADARGLALVQDTSPAADFGGDAEIDVTRLRVALARLSRRLRRHELAGLTPTQLAALSTIGKTGPMRLGDLAAAEGIAPSTLTRLVTGWKTAGTSSGPRTRATRAPAPWPSPRTARRRWSASAPRPPSC
jgi:hypothetical protein